jgi:two-component system, OmpR family, alkaline phosphatase synthesis response regulator PhoP
VRKMFQPEKGSETAHTDHHAVTEETRLRILIVDDMKTSRTHTQLMLVEEDYIIQEASDGVEALELAMECRPHLVLLDIVMPKMDGITCCKELKSNPFFKNVKVIMVTGKGDYKQIAEAFRAGCDDYITKPIKEEELKEKVDELVKYIRARNRLLSAIDNSSHSRSS